MRIYAVFSLSLSKAKIFHALTLLFYTFMQAKRTYSTEQNVRTLVVLAAGMLVLFFVFHKPWLSWIALAVLLVAAFSDWLSAKFAWAWLKLAEILGKVNSTIILSLAFFVILFPLAMVRRLFVKNAMSLKRPEGASTLYVTRDHLYTAQDMDNPW
jgi:hypothetical protein